MGSLSELLTRAQVRVEEEKAIEELKRKKAKSVAEVEEINAKVKEWKEAQEWVTVGRSLSLVRWVCACGASGLGQGLEMVYQAHARYANETRYIVPSPTLALPTESKVMETVIVEHRTAICAECAPSKGYTV